MKSIIGRAVRSLPTWSDEDDRFYAHPFTITGDPGLAGRTVTKETALTFSVVYACIKILSDSIASLPLHMYMRLSNGGRVRADDRQIYRILSRSVNPEISTFRWKSVVQAHLAAWGNHFSYVQRTGDGRVVSLWPLNPDLITVRRNDVTTELEYEFRHPKIPRVFNRSQVFHIPGFGYNGLVGKSPITLAREAIGLGLAAEEFGSRFYGDGTHPGMVAMHPHKLDPESHENLKKSLTTAVGGLGKSHRLLLLEEGMKIENISIPPEEAQFLATRKFQVQEICRFFNMKPHMVADLDRATFSNIEHQGIEFVVHTLGPWLSLIEAELSHYFLLPEERRDFYFEFMVEKFLRGDIKARYGAYQIARNAGWMNADEIREKENMGPVPDGLGKIYIVVGGAMSLEAIGSGGGEEPVTVEKIEEIIVMGMRAIQEKFDKSLLEFRAMNAERHNKEIVTSLRDMVALLFHEWLPKLMEGLGEAVVQRVLPFIQKEVATVVDSVVREIKAGKEVDEKRLMEFVEGIRNSIVEELEDDLEKRDAKQLAEFTSERERERTVRAVADGEAKLHMDSVKEELLRQNTEILSKQKENEKDTETRTSQIAEKIRAIPAEISAENKANFEGALVKFNNINKKSSEVFRAEMKELFGKIDEIQINKTLSDSENKLQIDSLREGLLEQIVGVYKKQDDSRSKFEAIIKGVRDEDDRNLEGIAARMEEYTKGSISNVVTKLEEGNKKNTDKANKEIKKLSGQIGEIQADKTLSDGERKLQIDSLREELTKLINQVAKEQKGYNRAVEALQKIVENNNVDMDVLISGVGGIFTKELAKLGKEQEKYMSKLLAGIAEEKRLREERTEVMVSQLEDMVGETRKEMAELKNNQSDSEAMHSDEIARLENTITTLESRHNSLSSGRSIANKDKVVSQYTPIIQDAVQMILNRESIAVKRAVKKFATNKDKLIEWLEDFYRGLPEFMHLKLDRILNSFIEAVQVEVMIERGVSDAEAPIDLSVLTHEYIRDYIQRHVGFSLNRLKKVIGNDDSLAVEVVIDEWFANRAEEVATTEAMNVGQVIQEAYLKPEFRAYITDVDKLEQKHLKPIEQAAQKIVGHETRAVHKAMGLNAVDSKDFESWLTKFYKGDFLAYSKKTMAPSIKDCLSEGSLAALKVVGKAPKDLRAEPTESFEEFKDTYVHYYALQHSSSSERQILSVIEEAKEKKEELAATVLQRLDEWNEKRPLAIAENEVVAEVSAVGREVWRRTGVTKLMWVLGSNKSCPFCTQLSGKIVGIQENFLNEGEVLTAKYEKKDENRVTGFMKMKIKGPKTHPPIHRGGKCRIVPVL